MEIPKTSVVSQQTYDAATLSGPLSNQVAALKAAGAQVVAMATIPAATALTMLPAASSVISRNTSSRTSAPTPPP